MRRALGAAAVAACLVGVGGCSSGEADSAPSPTSSSSTPSETPSASPSPTAVAPTMPPEAAERTAAGAEAFVRHWFEVLEYAYATGDASELRQYSAENCASCNRFLERIEGEYARGGSFEGVAVDVVSAAAPPPDDLGALVSAQIMESRAIARDGSGAVVSDTPARGPTGIVFAVEWRDGRWLAFGVGQDAA